jgi:hypothetical protein
MRCAYVLGWVNARIILTLLYGLFLAPFAIVRRVILLLRKREQGTYWIRKEMPCTTIDSLRRPF